MSVSGDPSAEVKPEARGVGATAQSSVLSPQSSLTALNLPRPLTVEADEVDGPRAVTIGGRRVAVEAVLDSWRIDDEWWREEISRRYYQLALADGRTLTIFLDLLGGDWYAQRYSAGLTATAPASDPDDITLAS